MNIKYSKAKPIDGHKINISSIIYKTPKNIFVLYNLLTLKVYTSNIEPEKHTRKYDYLE